MSKSVKQSFENLINELKEAPDNAQTSFEVTSVSNEGLSVNNKVRQFSFQIDEPELLGGEDGAPNPVEYVLGALGSCQAITYRALAALKGIQLDKVTVKTKGDLNLKGFLGLDREVRPGYQKVVFETIIESEESPEKLEKLAAQVEALCPVLDILEQPVEVEGKWSIERKQELAH